MKTENSIAKTIFNIGVVVIVLGIIGSLILGGIPTVEVAGYHATYNWGLALGGSFASLIAGFLLVGFAEIITLLQRNAEASEKSSQMIAQLMQNQDKINLHEGTYTVGDLIEPGHYGLTASGKLHIYDVDFEDTIDEDLNGGSWDCDLNLGDTIEVTGFCELKRI